MTGMCGFSILNSILGGQTLAAVSNNNLSWTWVSSLLTFSPNLNICVTVLGLSSSPSHPYSYVLFLNFSIFTNPYCSRSDIILRLQSPQLVRTPCLDPSLYHLHYNTRGWWKTPYQSTFSGTCHSYHDFKLCFDCCWVRHHLRAVKLGLYELLQTWCVKVRLYSTSIAMYLMYTQLENILVFFCRLRPSNCTRESWIFSTIHWPIFVCQVSLQCLGAAVAINAPLVAVWNTGYADGNVGGLLEAMLRPTGNFGKFLTVLLSLSVTGNIAASFYSISLNIQVFIPWLVIVPRYILSVLATAMYDFYS